jgi:Holliday junction resolvasome RuvABC endonuclease subunit
MKEDTSVILALFPNVIGLGYACLENPQTLLKVGVIKVRPMSNKKALSHVKELVDLFDPKIVILRDFDTHKPLKNKRIQQLLNEIITYAKEKHIRTFQYSRQQIRDVFELHSATSKYEISKQIITWFPSLADRAPKKRKPWLPEDSKMGIFDAMALAITHEHLNE